MSLSKPYQLTTWCTVPLELELAQLVKKCLYVMEFEGHYHVKHSPTIVPVLSQIETVHSCPSHSFKVHFNTNLAITLRSSQLSPPFRLSPYLQLLTASSQKTTNYDIHCIHSYLY